MRTIKRSVIASGVVVFVAWALILFFRSIYTVPILMYHTVYPDAPYENRLAVSVKTFERQMRFLRENRYAVVPLEEVVDLIRKKIKIPPRTVAITFDDGYRDNYTYVFPIVKRYNIPITDFIIVQEVGRPAGDRLSWGQIKEMQGSGLVKLGSHAVGPEPLINISSDTEVVRQISDSKKILEKELGRPVTLFSYPEGLFTPKIRQFVIDAGYRGAVATKPSGRYRDDDCYALRRIRVSENAKNLFIFWTKCSGYYTFFKKHRRK